ncbi:MAG TPA: hypothetical protein VHZ51_04070 [Ktedonobacteraceae bacterium]|nr:hypothetical protein [Ktedonobacteraceae bacterium]
MTSEEMHALEPEMQERGRASRTSEFPFYVAGVLIALYGCAKLDIDRMALAYAFSLLVDATAQPGTK